MAIDPAFGGPERKGYRYPLYRRNDRPLPPEWAGRGYVWDIDNTYLVTEMRGVRDLIRIRFEEAVDKRPVPGAVPLLKGLRRHEREEARPPIHFVSASPHTMRETLEKRMLLDGVVHDGIAFRDWSKLRYLRDIFGYKIAALLSLRLEQPRGLRECLFGDDREHDPWVYTLYAQICAGELRGKPLYKTLRGHGVRRSSARFAADLADELPSHDPVEWIFIRRLRQAPRAEQVLAEASVEAPLAASQEDEAEGGEGEPTPPAPLPGEGDARLDARTLFVDDYAQTAAVLHACGHLEDDDLSAVLREVTAAGGGAAAGALLGRVAPERLENPSTRDLLRGEEDAS